MSGAPMTQHVVVEAGTREPHILPFGNFTFWIYKYLFCGLNFIIDLNLNFNTFVTIYEAYVFLLLVLALLLLYVVLDLQFAQIVWIDAFAILFMMTDHHS